MSTTSAQDIGAVADALGLGRFVLVGHSYGGSVVGAYAAAHPERVAGLLLVDPAGDVTQAPADALDRYLTRLKSADYARVSRAALQASLLGAKPETSERVLAALAAASPEAFIGCFEGLRRYDPVAALRGYPGEAFAILQAQRENEATSVHRLLPALRYATLPGRQPLPDAGRPARRSRAFSTSSWTGPSPRWKQIAVDVDSRACAAGDWAPIPGDPCPRPRRPRPEPGLSRVLGLWSLDHLRHRAIQPTAPMPLFGVVNERKPAGNVVTTILIAMVAMLVTAISYGRMAAAYPAAGSAYTYVGRELHPALGQSPAGARPSIIS